MQCVPEVPDFGKSGQLHHILKGFLYTHPVANYTFVLDLLPFDILEKNEVFPG